MVQQEQLRLIFKEQCNEVELVSRKLLQSSEVKEKSWTCSYLLREKEMLIAFNVIIRPLLMFYLSFFSSPKKQKINRILLNDNVSLLFKVHYVIYYNQSYEDTFSTCSHLQIVSLVFSGREVCMSSDWLAGQHVIISSFCWKKKPPFKLSSKNFTLTLI